MVILSNAFLWISQPKQQNSEILHSQPAQSLCGFRPDQRILIFCDTFNENQFCLRSKSFNGFQRHLLQKQTPLKTLKKNLIIHL